MAAGRLYEFGEFRLDPTERLLFCSNKHVPLPPKAVDVLVLLVERRGHLVDKDTLLKELWPDTFVEEGSLAQNISVLRKILTEGRDGKALIETIPKRGYRFIATIKEIAPEVVPRPAAEESLPAPQPLNRTRRRYLMWAAPLGLAMLGVGAYFAWHHYSPRYTLASRRIMLAVLPVQNLSGDPGREYISDGLTEEMIAQLGGLNPQRLGVIARTSSMVYKKTDKTVDKIGRELGVDYVLESSLRESGGRLRITSQLIRTRDQTHVWADNYDRPLGDALALESDVSRAVARQIQVSLTPQELARLAAARPVSREVHELYLLGRYHWNKRTDAGLKKAIDYFQQAIDRDPRYAPAYAGLADSYALLFYVSGVPPNEAFPKAKAAAEHALEIEEQLAEAHATLGLISSVRPDLAGAEREYKRALELNPNYATAHQWYAFTLQALGRQEEAISEIERARELDPVSVVINTDTGAVFYAAHRPDEAFAHLRKALELDPNFIPAHQIMALVYAQASNFSEAIAEAQKAFDLSKGSPDTLSILGYTYAAAGKREQARKVLVEVRSISRQRYVSPYWTALIYAGLGAKERALEELERAYTEQSPLLLNVKLDPAFDSLRADSRFQFLIRRLGLPL